MTLATLNTKVKRNFMLLQGPHGPFFYQLGRVLKSQGAQVFRVGFNLGDRMFWPSSDGFIAFQGKHDTWPQAVRDLLKQHEITDLVLYGDARPIHTQAIKAARQQNIRVHIFEEGYLRPYWISYERDGANGYSRLMSLTIKQIRAAVQQNAPPLAEAPARWGDLWQHMFWAFLYHSFVLLGPAVYPYFRPHRGLSIYQEFMLYCRKIALAPIRLIKRKVVEERVKCLSKQGRAYDLVLLQLEHDASFRTHSPFSSQVEFVMMVLESFAKGAPQNHHLVFKAHPLEDDRAHIDKAILRISNRLGMSERVHFIRGGKLASLLNNARAVVTVNSTAGQQALWRAMPLRVMGSAVYAKPELVSFQPLDAFFAHPQPPDMEAYHDFRSFLLKTSQVEGGFYSRAGRKRLWHELVWHMLNDKDPYDRALYK